MDSVIEDVFKDRVLDLRKNPNTRFIDQKSTPDLLSLTSALIVELFDEGDEFSHPEFQRRPEVERALAVELKKPPASVTPGENNKLFMHSLKLLSHAGILEETKRNSTNYYRVSNINALRKLANDERQSLNFIIKYVTEVFKQTNALWMFEEFRDSRQDADAYATLKSRFISFARNHMGAGLKGADTDTEARRILPKILNPLAIEWNMNGSIAGKVSKANISVMDLRYSRVNARDRKLLRSAETSRQQKKAERYSSLAERRSSRVTDAKKLVRARHQDRSEISGLMPATQVHHIFPASQFPLLASVLENLILLTPDEHNVKAHPLNNTGKVDVTYQRQLLFAKLDSIEESIVRGDNFYSIERFAKVVEMGYGLADGSLEASAVLIRRAIEDNA
ncbi:MULTISPECIES: hypothetical protein [Brevibacterium]|uniref:Restriction endonuclease n=1 Tax=Brevibacterium casei TaxID=33889 RepID=A0A7T4A0V6_9MICO|nr:hypothetical protein [Brevibacterium casei]QQB15257.1 hypothetical protein I6H47_04705 [Brevibacterium casei]